MTDELRTLLTEVAEGRVDPSQAAARLSEIDAARSAPAESPPPASSPDQGPTEAPAASDADAPASRVVVQASARPVRVLADPTVATLTVEGPHSVRREGDTLRVEVPVTATADVPGSYRYERKTGLSRWISQATFVGVPLTVRMNPELALDVEVLAGSLDIVGLRGPLAFSVTAGSVKVSDCAGPFTGTVRAGGAKLDVRPVSGASRIRVESGGVDVRLQSGSDVRLRARAELGEVKAMKGDGPFTRVVDREGAYEVVVGAGTATFDLDVVMGSVKVWTP